MSRAIAAVGLLLVCVIVASATLISTPAPVAAGGLPCFLCHGVNFEGSDIAPRLAGTKLTDDEILKQIRSPRGLMPAFPEYAQPAVVQWIHSAPTGQPTKAFSAQERSAVLATISAVAAARATAVLKAAANVALDSATATPSATATSMPTAMPSNTPLPSRAATAPPSAAAAAPLAEPAATMGLFAALGLSLTLVVLVLWQRQRG